MRDNRRQFLKTIGLAGFASSLPFTQLLALNPPEDGSQGFVVSAKEQETWLIAGRQAPVTIVVDKKNRGVQSASFCYEDIRPGDLIPVHKHLREVEIIFIQKGSGVFTLGDKEFAVEEGGAAFVPKGVWHGLRNTGTENIDMRFAYIPAGFEGYFREIGTPVGKPFVRRTVEEKSVIGRKWRIIRKEDVVNSEK